MTLPISGASYTLLSVIATACFYIIFDVSGFCASNNFGSSGGANPSENNPVRKSTTQSKKSTVRATGWMLVGNAPAAVGGTEWNSSNDGAGSGLDADMLDGEHGSQYHDATRLVGAAPLAVLADWATTAAFSVVSDSAIMAEHATSAGKANYAAIAGKAYSAEHTATADSAANAIHANSADAAATADNALLFEGHHWSEIPAAYSSEGLTIRVAKSGGDYTTIADGLAASAFQGDNCTVVVYPGVYAEQKLEIPKNVSLIGLNPQTCIVRYSSTTYNYVMAPTSALICIPYSGAVANLTIDNTRVLYPSVGLCVGWGWTAGETSGQTISVQNCIITGNSVDELYTLGNNDIRIDLCRVVGVGDSWSAIIPAGATYRFTNGTIDSIHYGDYKPAIWCAGQGNIYVENSILSCQGSSSTIGCVRGGDVGTGSSAAFSFINTSFFYYPYRIPWYVWSDGGVGSSWTLNLYNCIYAGVGGSTHSTVVYSTSNADTYRLNGAEIISSDGVVSGVTIASNALPATVEYSDKPSSSTTAREMPSLHVTSGGVNIDTVLRLQPGRAPDNPTTGTFYYDSVSNQPKYYNGSTWIALGGGATTRGATGVGDAPTGNNHDRVVSIDETASTRWRGER